MTKRNLTRVAVAVAIAAGCTGGIFMISSLGFHATSTRITQEDSVTSQGRELLNQFSGAEKLTVVLPDKQKLPAEMSA